MSTQAPTVPLSDALRDLDIEASVLRYYQTQFRECLAPQRPGQIQRKLSIEDVDTLRVIHHLITVKRFSVPETLAYLRKRSATRALLDEDADTDKDLVVPASRASRYGKVIAFTSGKGGVGKTTLALNVATELARLGFRTALVDADLGLANVHILAGVTPQATLEDVVNGTCTMRQALTRGPRGINILAGASGLLSLAELGASERARLVEQMEELEREHDVLLIDTSAGLTQQVLDFVACSDETVVVTTGDLTAIADAYAMIKVISQRQPTLPLRVLVNRVPTAYQATVVMRRLLRCADRFLTSDIDLGEVGYVLEDPVVGRAIEQRTPFVVGHPRSRAAKTARRAAEHLMAVELRRGESGGPRATFARFLDVVRPGGAIASASAMEA